MTDETTDKEAHADARKGIAKNKELLRVIERLSIELDRRDKIIQSITDYMGRENFDEMLAMQGYQRKK